MRTSTLLVELAKMYHLFNLTKQKKCKDDEKDSRIGNDALSDSSGSDSDRD